MSKCYHNYLFTILLGVAMALGGCAPSKTEIEWALQGRWQRVGAPNVHDPFQSLATEYIELRSNGVLVSLLADSAPRTFWTIATGAYSVPQVGQIIVHGKCWQGWQNHDCSRTYRFGLNQDHLVIFDNAYEGRSVEYTRFGPASMELPLILAPPMPSATPMGQNLMRQGVIHVESQLAPQKLGPRPMWFNALLLLDAFMLGGLVAFSLVNQLLESTMDRLITVAAQSEILNVLDHLIPYWVGYIGISLLLGLATVGAYLWLRTRS